jgi:cysteine sulfinate desulfinase/cysteine desulfurase-like protein
MKKFLDFTHDQTVLKRGVDPFFVPLGLIHKRAQNIKKLIEKLKFGFKAQNYPYIYRFKAHTEAQIALYMSLYSSQVVESGKNQYLFEASGSKGVLEFAKMAKKFQIVAQLVGLDPSGRLNVAHLEQRLSPKTLIFSQRLYHPLLGTLNDQDQIVSALLKDKGVLYHLDITGALGEVVYDLDRFDADFISFDLQSISDSLQGGILFSKHELYEGVITSAPIDVCFLETLMSSLEELYQSSNAQMLKKITLKMELVRALNQALPDVKTVIQPPLESLSQVVIHLPQVHAEALNFMLLDKKICLDLGGGDEQSLKSLLELMDQEPSQALSCFALRIDPDLTSEQIEGFVHQLSQAYHSLMKGAL